MAYSLLCRWRIWTSLREMNGPRKERVREKQDKKEDENGGNSTSGENRDKELQRRNKVKMEKQLKEEGIKWGQKLNKTEERKVSRREERV